MLLEYLRYSLVLQESCHMTAKLIRYIGFSLYNHLEVIV